MTSKELREKRAPLATAIKALADKANTENRDFTGEEQKEWDKLNPEYDSFSKQITRAERAENIEAEQTAPINNGENRQLPGREDRNTRAEDEERENAEGDEAFGGDDGASIDDWRTVGEGGPSSRLMGGNPQQQAMAMQAW